MENAVPGIEHLQAGQVHLHSIFIDSLGLEPGEFQSKEQYKLDYNGKSRQNC